MSCETFSHDDLHRKQEQVAVNKHPCGGFSSLEVDRKAHGPSGKNRGGSKGLLSSVHLSSCFPPGSASYVVPNPMMSPGRAVLRGDSSGKAWPYSGPVPLSGSVAYRGSVPYGSPKKHNTGHVKGNPCPLKKQCALANRLSAFKIIPVDVVGKKKPPGYESDEPTSPVVTCIGRVRMKHKQCRPWRMPIAGKERGEKKGKPVKTVNVRSPEDDKHSSRIQGTAKGPVLKGVSPFQSLGTDLSLSYEVCNKETNETLSQPVCESYGSLGDENLTNAEGGEANGHRAESEARAPPPNSLLLIRGSRNSDRLKELQAPCPVSVLTRRLSRTVERQCPLLKLSSEGRLWNRRAVAQPT